MPACTQVSLFSLQEQVGPGLSGPSIFISARSSSAKHLCWCYARLQAVYVMFTNHPCDSKGEMCHNPWLRIFNMILFFFFKGKCRWKHKQGGLHLVWSSAAVRAQRRFGTLHSVFELCLLHHTKLELTTCVCASWGVLAPQKQEELVIWARKCPAWLQLLFHFYISSTAQISQLGFPGTSCRAQQCF